MGYRASIQASTKHSPYYMCFQQHMRLPVDNEMCDGDGDSDDDDDKTEEEIDLKIQRLLSSHEKSFAKQRETSQVLKKYKKRDMTEKTIKNYFKMTQKFLLKTQRTNSGREAN